MILLGAEDWTLIDFVPVAVGAAISAFIFSRYPRMSVDVSREELCIRNAWRTVSVKKSHVTEVTARALYGVACPLLHVQHPVNGWRRKIAVVGMPFQDVEILGLEAPVTYDL
jgi:hypothetical protein